MSRNLKELIRQMTLEEKAGLCSGADFWNTMGIERLGIPSVMMTDGPHGLRKQEGAADHLGLNKSVNAVCFPAACATASSFDVELMERMGQILGDECQAENVSILLGPAVNIKRSPLCGRNFEYMSEDPYLTGKMASAYIRGVQSKGIGTSMKHFAANNQETDRMQISSEVSERAFREIYLPAFEEAVKKAYPKTVMCSYNKINGVFSSENKKLLTDILRDEWGFEGYVVSDWGAVNDRVKGLKAGLDLEMPGSGGYNTRKIIQAVENGELEEEILDRTVERILKVVFSYTDNRKAETVFGREKDHKAAADIETECAVLLENRGVLPLKKEQKVVYIGEFAKKPRYQGGGSSHINTDSVVSALETAVRKGRAVEYVKGFSSERDEMTEEELKQACEAAAGADVVVIFAGLPDSFESEGYDRTSMELPKCQNRLIEAVAEIQKNVVVGLHNGRPVETPWAESVNAILEMYLGGEGIGEASDRLLFGEANPGGRLAETFPYRLEDNPSYLNFPGDGRTVLYGEDIFVGYRYYDEKKVPVRWAFGHGLSYTEFSYSNMKLSSAEMKDGDILKVSIDVENTGKRAGSEVVQLYVSDKDSTVPRAVKELKGFAKVFLNPGEKKMVTMELCARDFAYYETKIHDWYTPSGTYEIQIGHASDEIREAAELTFTTDVLLPFTVDMTTTMGELMNHPKTAGKMMEYLEGISQGEEPKKEDGEVQLVTPEIIAQMPLKTFLSVIPGEAIEQMIVELNALCAEEGK